MYELDGKVDSFILKEVELKNAPVRKVPSRDLLTWNRLDLGFKLFYARHRKSASSIAELVYRFDISSQTLGTFSEIGNDDKDSLESYIESFEDTFERISSTGFDPKASLIPVAMDGTILNGAHRTASCILAHRDAVILDTGLKPIVCDFKHFQKKGIPEDIIRLGVREFIRNKPGVYVAFLWPSGRRNLKANLAEFKNVIYHTKIDFTPRGAFNLICELYRHMDWIGDRQNSFAGAKRKMGECFPDMSSVHVVVFHEEEFARVTSLKSRIRDTNCIGFSSVHITDTHEEAIEICNTIFCENGLHLLNNADPGKFDWEKRLRVHLAGIPGEDPREDCVIDSGFVLEVYGLRKASDIDLVIDDDFLSQYGIEVDVHDRDLVHHGLAKKDLIYDPRNHFVFRGRRYLSLTQIRKMKSARGDSKDKIDVQLMDSIIDRSFLRWLTLTLRQAAFHMYHRTKMATHHRIRSRLEFLGLLDAVKALVRRASLRG